MKINDQYYHEDYGRRYSAEDIKGLIAFKSKTMDYVGGIVFILIMAILIAPIYWFL